MKILVTGGNGFIGSHVVKQLLERGYEVRCSVRSTSKRKRLEGLDVEFVEADVRNKLQILEAVNGCDGVIHCASLSNWNDLNSPALGATILDGTCNLLEAVVAQEAKMVYVSSAAALGACQEPTETRDESSSFNLSRRGYQYAALKASVDSLCMEAVELENANIVMVHPTETYGPEDTAHVTASTLIEFAAGPICLVTNGGTSVAHVEDVATGIVAAFEKGKTGNKYILGGDNCSFSEIAEMTQKRCNTNHRVWNIPRLLIRVATAIMPLIPSQRLKALAPKYRYALHYWYFDTSKATRELGVTFRSPQATLESTIDWLKTQKNGIGTSGK